MTSIRQALDNILNKVDYTSHQCSATAMVGAAVPEDDFIDAREALQSDTNPTHRPALQVLLDQIDFTSGACTPFEMVGACLPASVIQIARKSLVDHASA